jgi:hypothetical protein
MAATATAPARSPRTRHAPARLVPVAVGRTAVAVGGIADSGLMVRLTRGRLWIGLLATLLVGIVGLNVVALSFSARSSETARKAEALEQRNSALRAQIANQLDTAELQATAAELGLLSPAPGEIRYLKTGPDDAAAAAKRLRDGDLTTVDAAAIAPVTPVSDTTDPVVPDPATTAPVDTAAAESSTTEPPPTDTATTASATADPASSAADIGGVAAP